ncbi:hypothetical protein LOD99_2525 [Oopsacas minuta]|uniref:Uncharacterized protein n=1 Tax=Oopsacas minuta TaxID=111878 RepID=A0AAV7K1W2_9METZ|nr:hypothetical protein LOD99_2525 [Oopsacas minuta]
MANRFRALSNDSRDVKESGIKVRNTRHPTVPSNIIRSGFLTKLSGGLFKSWQRRFFVLNPQCLSYFRDEREVRDQGKEPSKRLFLSDVNSVTGECSDYKRSFLVVINLNKGMWVVQAASVEDQEKWIEVLIHAIEADRAAEQNCPKRLSMKRVNEDTKRVLLVKEEGSIGCTVKKAGEFLIVSRIIEGSYIARTGILRPDDEILEIDGDSVKNKSIEEVIDLIRSAPESILATIRPFRPIPRVHDTSPSSYTQVAPFSVGKSKSVPSRGPSASLPPIPTNSSVPLNYADIDTENYSADVPSLYCNIVVPDVKKIL